MRDRSYRILDVSRDELGFTYCFTGIQDVEIKRLHPSKILSLPSFISQTNDIVDSYTMVVGNYPCDVIMKEEILEKSYYTEFLDYIQLIKPLCFLFETRKFHSEEELSKSIDSFRSLGYSCSSKVMNAMEQTGIPFVQYKGYIIGIQKTIGHSMSFPENEAIKHTLLDFLNTGMAPSSKHYVKDKEADALDKTGCIYNWSGNGYKEMDRIYLNLKKKPLYCDAYGIRRITPQELLKMKGYSKSLFIPESNLEKAYSTVLTAPNVWITNKILRFLFNEIFAYDKNQEIQETDDALQTTSTQKGSKKKCFVIMPFQEQLDSYYREIIKPLMETLGYEVLRGDEIYGIDAIIDQIKDAIRHADLLIADLTGKNPNVNYELGFADALDKTTIRISQAIEDIPFDYHHIRIVLYDTKKVNWQEQLKEQIRRHVQTIEKKQSA